MARNFDQSKFKVLRHIEDIEVEGKEIRIAITKYGDYEPAVTMTRLFERKNGELGQSSIGGLKVKELPEIIPILQEAYEDLRQNFNKYNAGEKYVPPKKKGAKK